MTGISRPRIRRSNIVIAEPMPGEQDLRDEFLRELRDGRLEGLIRRVLDIPDALGLLAPNTKVTIAGKVSLSKAFDKTARIFELAGAKGKLKRE